MKTSFFSATGSLLAIFLLITACKKHSGAGPDDPLTIPMFDQESYKHYEIATIRFKHAFALSSLVEAELDGSPVTLAAETDTTIIFAVWPDVYREGSSTLKFTSDGQSYSLVVNVIAAPSVADPETIFSSYQDQISQSITFIEELKPVDTGGIFQDQDVIAAIDSSKAILASLGDEWNALSPEQKLAVTNLLQANSSELNVVNAELQLLTEHVFSTDLGITLKSTGIICQTGSGLERYQCVAGTIGKLLFQTVKYTGKAYLAALTIPIFAKPFPVLAGFPIAVSGFLSAKAILSGLNALILTKQFLKFHVRAVVFHVFDVDINNLKTTGTPIEFVKNKPKAMPVYIKLRRVLDNDVNSSTPWLSNFVSTIHQYNSFCDKYPTAFGKYKVKMPLPHQKDFSLFRLSDISVKNITNTKIKAAKITGTLENPIITFETDESEDFTFNFDILYDDKVNAPLVATIEASMKANQPVGLPILGIWHNMTMRPDSTGLYDAYWSFSGDSSLYINSHPDYGGVQVRYHYDNVAMTLALDANSWQPYNITKLTEDSLVFEMRWHNDEILISRFYR